MQSRLITKETDINTESSCVTYILVFLHIFGFLTGDNYGVQVLVISGVSEMVLLWQLFKFQSNLAFVKCHFKFSERDAFCE